MKQIFVIIILILAFNNLKAEQVIFINELMAKNDSFVKDDKGKFSDWIEIYNSSLEEVDLGGYYLSDDKDTLAKWKIPTGTLIAGKGYYIFWASGEPENGNRHTNFKLSADGETLALVMPDGITKVDTVKFGLQDTDISYGRIEDGADIWIYFESPTFGTSNKNSSSEILPVVINEIMASNTKTIMDEENVYEDWIELYNNSNLEIDISGLYLTDEPKANPTQWRIPAGTKLQAKSHLLIWCDSDPKDGPYHTNFKLSKDGDTIAIFAKDGTTLIDQIVFGKQGDDISYGRATDGNTEWRLFSTPTPGTANNPNDVEPVIVTDMRLEQNAPNPFNESTNIVVHIESPRDISLRIYNQLGEAVYVVFDGFKENGTHTFPFSAVNLPKGIYYCRLSSGNKFTTRIMSLIE
jgi:hypothetical protein